MKRPRLVIYPLIIIVTASLFYFFLRKNDAASSPHDLSVWSNHSLTRLSSSHPRDSTHHPKTQRKETKDSIFFDYSKAESVPPFFFLDNYYKINPRAAHAAQLTKDETKKLQDIIDRTFAKVSSELAERSRLYKTIEDENETKRIYYIRSAEDGGAGTMKNLQADMIELLGRDRATILGNKFSRPQFGGCFGYFDIKLTITNQKSPREGIPSWNYNYSIAEQNGRGPQGSSMESSDIGQFRLTFGHNFLPEE